MGNRYIVHGKDRASGQRTQKVIEAPSAQEAESVAARIGIEVVGSEVYVGQPLAGDAGAGHAPAEAGAHAAPGPEDLVWKGSPSQWLNFWWFVLTGALVLGGLVLALLGLFAGGAIIGPLIALGAAGLGAYRFLLVRTERFTLTTQRLKVEKGIIARAVEETELYRVVDTAANQSVLQRLLGVGTLTVVTSDERNPNIVMPWVPDPRGLREKIRTLGEARRRWRKVAEIEVS
jgi:membrane protein YdbS with pleckstrin-like domain